MYISVYFLWCHYLISEAWKQVFPFGDNANILDSDVGKDAFIFTPCSGAVSVEETDNKCNHKDECVIMFHSLCLSRFHRDR